MRRVPYLLYLRETPRHDRVTFVSILTDSDECNCHGKLHFVTRRLDARIFNFHASHG